MCGAVTHQPVPVLMALSYLRDVLGREDAATTRSEAVALGSVLLGVAQLAVHLAVGGVAAHHGVQGAMAVAAVVAPLVEGLPVGEEC